MAVLLFIKMDSININEISNFISNFDFSNAETIEASTNDSIESLKQEILNNPESAPEKLEELIRKLSK